jgi:thioredoxin 1
MKKNIIIAIVVIIAVLGIGILIASQNAGKPSDSGLIQADETNNNPAVAIGPGELKLTDDNFDSEIKQSKGVAMVDMFSPTCPHCQKIGPIVSEIAKETQGKYKIGKLNANTNSKTATEFEISNVPALIFFKDGKEADRLIGEQTKDVILAKLQEISK